jgi:hypothetical protein
VTNLDTSLNVIIYNGRDLGQQSIALSDKPNQCAGNLDLVPGVMLLFTNISFFIVIVSQINSAGTHYILYKDPASRVVYTGAKAQTNHYTTILRKSSLTW